MSYVYRQTEPQLWTVGHYSPAGVWEPESDQPDQEKAAARVHYLNGGQPDQPDQTAERLRQLTSRLRVLGFRTIDQARDVLDGPSFPCTDGHLECAPRPGGRCMGEVHTILSELEASSST